MTKRSFSGQLNMYDFFREPVLDENGAPKDAEMVSFTPEFKEDKDDDLEVIDFNLDTELDAKKLVNKADQVISKISAKARQTDEEIWIEEQIALRRKKKPKARSIDEQDEFTQENIFSSLNIEEPTKEVSKEEVSKKEVSKKEGKKKAQNAVGFKKKKIEDVVPSDDVNVHNTDVIDDLEGKDIVMKRIFVNAKGKKTIIAYINYNKVYERMLDDIPQLMEFSNSAEAVSYYVDRMHAYQDTPDFKELKD